MTNKERLFFIGECLTLNHDPEKIPKIKDVILTKGTDWEEVVWMASNHFVLPALYLNLKNAGLLANLPEDLVQHLEEITSLNRGRNQQIMQQACEITAILNRHNIFPIFIKGTAHLLGGLYQDIAERMVGDIDFLVGRDDVFKAAEILIAEGYHPLREDIPYYERLNRHYSRLVSDAAIAGVEIHSRIIKAPFDLRLDFKQLNSDKQPLNNCSGAFTLSPAHHFLNNMMLVQMNDDGFFYGAVYLRQMYDLFLLSRACDPLKTLKEFGHYFHRLNAYLCLSAKVLGNPGCLTYEPNWSSRLFLKRLDFLFRFSASPKVLRFIFYFIYHLYNYLKQLIVAIFWKDKRSLLYYRIKRPGWFKKHLQSWRH